jgi:predicted DNA-binding transcriptional regulator YafY
MNRLERLTAILLLLQEQPRTATALAHQFEVSRRTVLRDIQALSEMGVPVIAQSGPGGGYSLPPSYRVNPLPLTVGEAFLLQLTLSPLTKLTAAPFATERSSLLAKLRKLLPPELGPTVDQLLAVTAVATPTRAQSAPYLDELIEAAQDQRPLCITYQSAERRSVQHILPRQLVLEQGHWYCHAYAFERGEERIYRVDRIEALETAPVRYQSTNLPPPRPYDHAAHPEVIVHLSKRGVAYVESEPHLGQAIQRHADGSGVVRFRCPPSELAWYARYFAGFGAEANVESPPELRSLLRQLGEILLRQY